MKKLAFIAAVLLAGCGGGFSSDDKTSLRHAMTLDTMAYGHVDGGAPAALMRGAYCSDWSIARRHGMAPDAGPIDCDLQ